MMAIKLVSLLIIRVVSFGKESNKTNTVNYKKLALSQPVSLTNEVLHERES